MGRSGDGLLGLAAHYQSTRCVLANEERVVRRGPTKIEIRRQVLDSPVSKLMSELLNVLAVKYPVKERRPEPKRVSLAMISTDDENEYESEEKEEGEVGAGI